MGSDAEAVSELICSFAFSFPCVDCKAESETMNIEQLGFPTVQKKLP